MSLSRERRWGLARFRQTFWGLSLGAAWAASVGGTGCASLIGLEDRTYDADGSPENAEDSGSSSAMGPLPEASDDGVPPIANGDAGCPPTGPCALAPYQTAPWQVAADDSNVYWTEFGTTSGSGDGSVKGCAISGCSSPFVYAPSLNNPRGLAIDSQNIYWGTNSIANDGGVWSCPLAGCSGPPRRLASANSPYGIAVDATYVYWVDEVDNSVHRVAKSGASADVVLSDGGSLADGAANPLFDVGQIAVDTAFVYVNDQNAGGLFRVPITGGDPELFYAGYDVGDWPVAVDATSVYFGETHGALGYVLRLDKSVTNAAGTQLATGLKRPWGIALDHAGEVYWVDYGAVGNDGLVGKVATTGGGQVTLASGLPSPSAAAVNGQFMFWADIGAFDSTANQYVVGTGYIGRVAK